MLLGAAVVGYAYFTSLYLQEVLGFRPLETGLLFHPRYLTVIVTSTQLTPSRSQIAEAYEGLAGRTHERGDRPGPGSPRLECLVRTS